LPPWLGQHDGKVKPIRPVPAVRRGPVIRLAAAALGVLPLLLVVACDPPGQDEDVATTGCAATVGRASRAVEVAEQVQLLDEALLACRSYSALTSELDRYPGIIGYDAATFVSLRCGRVDDQAIRASPACAVVIAPTSTLPPTTTPDVVFVGDTLDGRQVEIRPSGTTPFVGDVPAVVQQTVDIAFESGCEGVIAQRDRWAALSDDPATGDEASVYAQHAQNVADYLRCDSEPLG
jgi:hypothetical protein